MFKLISPKLIFCLLSFFILDVCVFPAFRIQGAQPYLLYVLVVYSAFKWPWQRTLAVAFLAGLLRDIAGVHALGVETAVVLMNAFGLILFSHKMVRDNLVNRLLATFFFVFVTSLTSLVFTSLLQNPQWMSWHAIGMIVLIAAFSSLVTPLVFAVISRLFNDEPVIKQMGLFN